LVLGVAAAALAMSCGAPAARGPETPHAPTTEATGPALRHRRSKLVLAAGAPRHRVRDVLVAEGDPQIVEAKFAYGLTDLDLKDEYVVVDVERPSGWEPVGTFLTSEDAPGDDGGRVRAILPKERALPMGRHRVRFTVQADGTVAEGVIVVVPRGERAFVSDVDGTLTSAEFAEVPALLLGTLPAAHPGAARVLTALAERGYVPIYLTARPEWLMPRTRAFLTENGFPPGVLVTRRDKSGAIGSAAAAYKRNELERISFVVSIGWAFGNKPSDTVAYAKFVADPSRRVFFRLTDEAHGGRRIESYLDLLDGIAAR
jgi:hypothetical protein